jgi:hypothetical protein
VRLPALLSVRLCGWQWVESPAQQTGRQPVEPRVELPGWESGRLWVELLVKRPPDASSVTYATSWRGSVKSGPSGR